MNLKRCKGARFAAVATMATVAMGLATNARAWELDTSLSHAGASFLGPLDGFYAGSSVAGVGDANGDGYSDMLVEAAGVDQGGPVYLILGKASGWSTDVSLSAADASFLGEAEGDVWGMTIGRAGDVNGDGLDDFLVSAPYNDERDDMAGQVYLLLGRESGWSSNTSLANADASFLGEEGWDRLGTGLAGGGDVDGDGIDDFLFGAPTNCDGRAEAGKAYLVLGRGSGFDMDTRADRADGTFIGNEGEQAGGALAIAGDLDGDGYADIAIGTGNADDNGDNSGKVYLVYGHEWTSTPETRLASADAAFIGEAEDDWAGSVAAAGDVNGDGHDDLLIGAPGSDDGGTDAGQVYLLLGRSERWSGAASLATADASFVGESPLDYLGTVDGAGDVNGDGYCDLLMGASDHDESAADAGEVYLFLGRASDWGMDTSLLDADGSFWGEHAGDSAGSSLAGAGDVDGDGLDEFLIGANTNDDAGTDAGKVYVFTEPPPCMDEDGDGWTDCDGDCRDDDAAIHPGLAEDCADGQDNDCDGEVDSADDECHGGDDTGDDTGADTDDDTGDDAGDDPSDDTEDDTEDDTDEESTKDDDGPRCACGAAPMPSLGSALFAIGAHILLRRRRSRPV